MLKIGNSAKDSKYLKRIKDAIEGDKSHPRNNGVKMQAHHVISGEGMKLSGLGHKILQFGYDINLLPNLIFIPCSLQGACYLGVQPHRGNHTALADQDDYVDDKEPMDYHKMIMLRVRGLELYLSKECPGDKKTKSEKVVSELNKLSETISLLIQNKPGEAPLTNIARNFTPGNPIGCGSVDSITFHGGSKICSVKRNHEKNQAPDQINESITFKSDGRYKLKPGR